MRLGKIVGKIVVATNPDSPDVKELGYVYVPGGG